MKYFNITQSTELPDVSRFAPFKAVVTVEEPVTWHRQEEISLWLVRMGCRYLMSCGEGCESWRDSVRQANLKLFDIDNLGPRDFVMTTAHPHEHLRAVFWYAKKFAKHPEVRFDDLLVIHIAATDRSTEYLAIHHRA